MRITFLGHLSIDVNVVKGVEHVLAGGGVVHGAITAHRLGSESTVVTRCAPENRARFSHMDEAGVRVVFLEGVKQTSIRNDYPTDNPDDRVSRIISRAESFGAADLESIETDVLHVNPLWAGEFPPELLPQAKKRAKLLGADAQGFLRTVAEDGSMVYRDWPGKERYMPLIDVFKADIHEGRIMTGHDEPRAAAKALHELGAKTVVLTHRDGVCVADSSGLCEAPFTGWTLEGRTGRGDTCTAAFLVAHAKGDIAEAARFAARITSEKMQYRGPYRG